MNQNIKVYLVGGAVRDRVLGRPVKDLDFVVVGATPEDMEDLGFQKVGADFPVFLHPQGSHEFALARTERKSGVGYNGFDVNFDQSVTLEDDLIRRDLTMNSMAVEVDISFLKNADQKIDYAIDDIIDPFNGMLDLNQRVIQHTSEAFADDPLRVLRAARFAARYNFEIDRRTQILMSKIAQSGEMSELPIERVFTEFRKAMMEDHGVDFAITLNSSFEERMMLLCMGMNPLEAKSLFLRLKAPTALINQVFMSCHLTRMVWETDDLNDLWGTFERANAWKNIPLLQTAVPVHLFWGDESTFKSLRKIMMALHLGSKVNFSSLTAEQQDTLKGKEISDAISEVRFKVVSNLF